MPLLTWTQEEATVIFGTIAGAFIAGGFLGAWLMASRSNGCTNESPHARGEEM